MEQKHPGRPRDLNRMNARERKLSTAQDQGRRPPSQRYEQGLNELNQELPGLTEKSAPTVSVLRLLNSNPSLKSVAAVKIVGTEIDKARSRYGAQRALGRLGINFENYLATVTHTDVESYTFTRLYNLAHLSISTNYSTLPVEITALLLTWSDSFVDLDRTTGDRAHRKRILVRAHGLANHQLCPGEQATSRLLLWHHSLTLSHNESCQTPGVNTKDIFRDPKQAHGLALGQDPREVLTPDSPTARLANLLFVPSHTSHNAPRAEQYAGAVNLPPAGDIIRRENEARKLRDAEIALRAAELDSQSKQKVAVAQQTITERNVELKKWELGVEKETSQAGYHKNSLEAISDILGMAEERKIGIVQKLLALQPSVMVTVHDNLLAAGAPLEPIESTLLGNVPAQGATMPLIPTFVDPSPFVADQDDIRTAASIAKAVDAHIDTRIYHLIQNLPIEQVLRHAGKSKSGERRLVTDAHAREELCKLLHSSKTENPISKQRVTELIHRAITHNQIRWRLTTGAPSDDIHAVDKNVGRPALESLAQTLFRTDSPMQATLNRDHATTAVSAINDTIRNAELNRGKRYTPIDMCEHINQLSTLIILLQTEGWEEAHMALFMDAARRDPKEKSRITHVNLHPIVHRLLRDIEESRDDEPKVDVPTLATLKHRILDVAHALIDPTELQGTLQPLQWVAVPANWVHDTDNRLILPYGDMLGGEESDQDGEHSGDPEEYFGPVKTEAHTETPLHRNDDFEPQNSDTDDEYNSKIEMVGDAAAEEEKVKSTDPDQVTGIEKPDLRRSERIRSATTLEQNQATRERPGFGEFTEDVGNNIHLTGPSPRQREARAVATQLEEGTGHVLGKGDDLEDAFFPLIKEGVDPEEEGTYSLTQEDAHFEPIHEAPHSSSTIEQIKPEPTHVQNRTNRTRLPSWANTRTDNSMQSIAAQLAWSSNAFPRARELKNMCKAFPTNSILGRADDGGDSLGGHNVCVEIATDARPIFCSSLSGGIPLIAVRVTNLSQTTPYQPGHNYRVIQTPIYVPISELWPLGAQASNPMSAHTEAPTRSRSQNDQISAYARLNAFQSVESMIRSLGNTALINEVKAQSIKHLPFTYGNCEQQLRGLHKLTLEEDLKTHLEKMPTPSIQEFEATQTRESTGASAHTIDDRDRLKNFERTMRSEMASSSSNTKSDAERHILTRQTDEGELLLTAQTVPSLSMALNDNVGEKQLACFAQSHGMPRHMETMQLPFNFRLADNNLVKTLIDIHQVDIGTLHALRMLTHGSDVPELLPFNAGAWTLHEHSGQTARAINALRDPNDRHVLVALTGGLGVNKGYVEALQRIRTTKDPHVWFQHFLNHVDTTPGSRITPIIYALDLTQIPNLNQFNIPHHWEETLTCMQRHLEHHGQGDDEVTSRFAAWCRHVSQTQLTLSNLQEWSANPRYTVHQGQTLVAHLWLIVGDELMYMSNSPGGRISRNANPTNIDKDADVQEMFLALRDRIQEERGAHQTMDVIPSTVTSKAAFAQHFRTTYGIPPLHTDNVTTEWHSEPNLSNIVDLVRSVCLYLEALVYKGDENRQLTSDQAQERPKQDRGPPTGGGPPKTQDAYQGGGQSRTRSGRGYGTENHTAGSGGGGRWNNQQRQGKGNSWKDRKQTDGPPTRRAYNSQQSWGPEAQLSQEAKTAVTDHVANNKTRQRTVARCWEHNLFPFIKVCTELLKNKTPDLKQKMKPGQYICTRKATTNYCNNANCKGNHNVGPQMMFQLFSDIHKHGSMDLKQMLVVSLTSLNPCMACAITDPTGAQIGGTTVVQRTKSGCRLMLHRTACFHCGKEAYLLNRQLANEQLSERERRDPNSRLYDIEKLGNKFETISKNGLQDERCQVDMNDHHSLINHLQSEIVKTYVPINGTLIPEITDKNPPIVVLKEHANKEKLTQGLTVPGSTRDRINLPAEVLRTRATVHQQPTKDFRDNAVPSGATIATFTRVMERLLDDNRQQRHQSWTQDRDQNPAGYSSRAGKALADAHPLEEKRGGDTHTEQANLASAVNEVYDRLRHGDNSVLGENFQVGASSGDTSCPPTHPMQHVSYMSGEELERQYVPDPYYYGGVLRRSHGNRTDRTQVQQP